MSQTDPEDRTMADQLPYRLDRIGHSLGITGTVREKNAIRVHRFNLLRGRRGGYHRHLAPYINQPAKDILFDTKIIGHDLPPARRCRNAAVRRRGPFTGPFGPLIALGTSDLRS